MKIKSRTAFAVVKKKYPRINPKDIYSNVDAVFLRVRDDEELIPVNITSIEKDTTTTKVPTKKTMQDFERVYTSITRSVAKTKEKNKSSRPRISKGLKKGDSKPSKANLHKKGR